MSRDIRMTPEGGVHVNSGMHMYMNEYGMLETTSHPYTVFHQINALSAEAENEPSALSDISEINYVISQLPQHKVLKI